MKALLLFIGLGIASASYGSTLASSMLTSILTPFSNAERADQIVIKNDGFVETGGPAYLQLGFVKGEKAGIWVKVPEGVERFKVDYFRVLMYAQGAQSPVQVFFHMGVAKEYRPSIPVEIENAAQITSGPYWNDIPAQGLNGGLRCAAGGELVGAALEFTHDGAPSVARDGDGISNAQANTLYAIPGGWNYSSMFGLTGDWILRIVGHEADASECGW